MKTRYRKRRIRLMMSAILMVGFTYNVSAVADVNLTSDGRVPGQPFAYLQTQIDNIQLTPGPQGERGSMGPVGPQGESGPLSNLSCDVDQIPKWDGSAWVCADMGASNPNYPCIPFADNFVAKFPAGDAGYLAARCGGGIKVITQQNTIVDTREVGYRTIAAGSQFSEVFLKGINDNIKEEDFTVDAFGGVLSDIKSLSVTDLVYPLIENSSNDNRLFINDSSNPIEIEMKVNRNGTTSQVVRDKLTAQPIAYENITIDFIGSNGSSLNFAFVGCLPTSLGQANNDTDSVSMVCDSVRSSSSNADPMLAWILAGLPSDTLTLSFPSGNSIDYVRAVPMRYVFPKAKTGSAQPIGVGVIFKPTNVINN